MGRNFAAPVNDLDDVDDSNRRDLLKAASALGVVGIAGCAGSDDSVEYPNGPMHADEVEWDTETDVVIAGYGGGGVAAGIEAAEAGLDVLILEKSEAGGGTTRHAGGTIYIGGGTTLQEELGISDSPENMANYLSAKNPSANRHRIKVFAEGGPEFYDWLAEDIGVDFPANLTEYAVTEPQGGGLAYTGSEKAHPYSEVADPAPRGHKERNEGQSKMGPALWEKLEAKAMDVGVEVEYNAAAKQLVIDVDDYGDVRVVGMLAETDDGDTYVRGSKGVVIATGGFCGNSEMIDYYNDSWHVSRGGLGANVHHGDGIKLAQTVGAQVKGMSNFTGLNFHYPQGVVNDGAGNEASLKGIAVDNRGQRYVNEDRYGGEVVTPLIEESNGGGFFIMDQTLVDEYGGTPEHPPLVIEKDTLADLADELELPVAPLTNTVEFYNEQAENGEDPSYHKAEEYLQPLDTPPYYAFDLTSDMVFLTLGGIRATPEGEVLDRNDYFIPGLYACSHAVACINLNGYDSGTGIGPALFFGRQVGKSIAGEDTVFSSRSV